MIPILPLHIIKIEHNGVTNPNELKCIVCSGSMKIASTAEGLNGEKMKTAISNFIAIHDDCVDKNEE